MDELEKTKEVLFKLHSQVKEAMDWDDDTSWLWFGLKNPLLGDISPVELILLGRASTVESFIKEASEG